MPFLFIRVEKQRTEIFLYIACCLILFNPFNVNILGFDTLSIFILSLIFSFAVLYLKKSGFYLLLILSILSAVAVFLRLPNLLVILFVFLVILYSGKTNNGFFSAKFPATYLLFTTLIICFGYIIYYDSLEDFFKASIKASSHDLKILFQNYIQHGLKMLLILSLLLGSYLGYKNLRDKKSKYVFYVVANLILAILIGLFVVRTKYSQNYSLFLSSLALSMVVVTILENHKEWLSLKYLVLYLFILFLFINPFGSNTGLLKATSLFLLLPFVLSFSNFKINSYWIMPVMILLPFSLFEKLANPYEERGLPALNTTINIDSVNYINTTKTKADFLERIDAEIKELRNKNVNVYFYGNKSHIFHYLFPETNLNIASFFQPIDELIYYSEIEKKINIKEPVAIFMVDTYPGPKTNSKVSLVGEKLLEAGFKKIDMGSFFYFFRY